MEPSDDQSPLKLAADTCKEIRDLAIRLYNEKQHQSELDDPYLIDPDKLSDCHHRDMCLLLLNLKQLNRAAQQQGKLIKNTTNEHKSNMDRLNLELQNLYYERLHLKKQIAKCREFETVYQDIELIPEEEFLRKASPELTQHYDEHQRMLNRLEFEYIERKRLAQEFEDLKLVKEKTILENRAKKAELEKLDLLLESFINASQPIQEYLQLPISATKARNEYVSMLPKPLYVFYTKATGYQESFDSIKVEIRGDIEEAKLLSSAEQARSESLPVSPVTATEKEISNDSETSKKRKSRARHENSDNTLYQKHPLQVIITFSNEEKKELQVEDMIFTYLTTLQVVVMDVKLSGVGRIPMELIGSHLFGTDNGTRISNPATENLLSKDGNVIEFKPQVAGGHCYIWLQDVCGVGYPIPLESVCNDWGENMESLAAFPRVLQQLRLRVKHWSFLNSILTAIEAGNMPQLPLPQSTRLISVTPNMILKNWSISQAEQDDLLQCTAIIEGAQISVLLKIFISWDYPNVIPKLEMVWLKHPSVDNATIEDVTMADVEKSNEVGEDDKSKENDESKDNLLQPEGVGKDHLEEISRLINGSSGVELFSSSYPEMNSRQKKDFILVWQLKKAKACLSMYSTALTSGESKLSEVMNMYPLLD